MMTPIKKRILFIMPLPPPVHGSAVVSQQIRDSRIINELFNCDCINLSISRRVSEVGKKSPVKIVRFISSFNKLFWKLMTKGYDLCYIALTCHGPGFLKDAPFALLCKLFHIPLVIHQHNKGMSKDVEKWPYRFLFPLVYKNAKVILLSKALYPDISRIVLQENILICPNGILDRTIGIKPKHSSSAGTCLLFISNLVKSKGVLDLIESCHILKGRGYSFYCRIIGNESAELSRKDIESEICNKNLEGLVIYEGARYSEEKNSALQDADIFVFPTYYPDECFPLCILEAMQHALPIITTDEGGIRDMVTDGENGIICDKKNPQSLAQAIADLIEQPELRWRMGHNGRIKYESSFTSAHFERKFVECLEQCI